MRFTSASTSWIGRLMSRNGPRCTLRYAGKSWWMFDDDYSAWRGLERLVTLRRASERDSPGCVPLPRLMAFRNDFREIARRRLIIGLFACLKYADVYDDLELGRLAIWLLGRCGRSHAVSVVAQLRDHDHVVVRREVARALRRMGALVELESMARLDADERVRGFATSKPSVPFAERLAHYTRRDVRRLGMIPPQESRPPLFVRLPLGPGRPPKTPQFIRAILEHIRLLVRGARSRSS